MLKSLTFSLYACPPISSKLLYNKGSGSKLAAMVTDVRNVICSLYGLELIAVLLACDEGPAIFSPSYIKATSRTA